MKQYLFLLTLLGSLLALPRASQGQSAANEFLFGSDSVIDVQLTTDIKKLSRERKNEKYQSAQFRFQFPDGKVISEKLEIKTRGVLRKIMCPNPPLLLNFKKAQDTLLKKAGTLKLVVGCDRGAYEEQLILKEYLVYRIYNLLTPKSIRPRLLKVHFADSKGEAKSFDQYAFLLEDIDDVAARNGCRHLKLPQPTELLNREGVTLFSIFQYMIGNTDFSVSDNKNTRLIQSIRDSAIAPYLIPYDFDYCGLVNARYAIPHPDYQNLISNVTDRLYIGLPRSEKELNQVLQRFMVQKPAMEALIQNQEGLWPQYRKEMLHFLSEFFDLIDQPERVREIFISPEHLH